MYDTKTGIPRELIFGEYITEANFPSNNTANCIPKT